MNNAIDIMSISHFVFFAVLGIYIKDKYELILGLCVLREVVEHMLVNNKCTKDLLLKYWPIPEKMWDKNTTNSLFDIIFSMVGYYVGNQIVLDSKPKFSCY